MKKNSIIALLLAALMLFSSCGSKTEEKKESEPEKESTQTEQKADAEYQKVTVMESEHYTVDSSMFTFMYYSNFANYVAPYAQYYGLTVDKPLSEQPYSDEISWGEYLCNITESNILNILCIAEHAISVGHEFKGIDTYLEEQLDLWKGYAKEEGLGFEEYLQKYFGEHVTEADVRSAFALQFYTYSYNEILAEEANKKLTEEYYAEYFEKNCDETTQTEPSKNVCHILFKTSDYESEEAAKAKAEEVLALYESGEKTRESFETLGKEYTADSNTYYENVPKGKMVDEFENWIYDPARNEGDTDIVLTTYGYHIMYFAGDGVTQWREDAKNEFVQSYLQEKTEEYSEKFLSTFMLAEDIFDLVPSEIPNGYRG